MFARNAEGASLVSLTEKGAGTEIAVFNPEVTGLNRVQDGPEQRALLRMAIFARKDIRDHTQGWFIDHQRFARQGTPRGFTQFFNAVSYTHLRAHETPEHLVCRLLLEKN